MMLLVPIKSGTDIEIHGDREIVHARGDFTDRKLWVTWQEVHPELKTSDSVQEIDQVFNELLKVPLTSFDRMVSYCRAHQEARNEYWCEAYEFLIAGKQCNFLLRSLCVAKGSYHFYLFCYRK